MKSLHQYIEERLIVNKDYKNIANPLLELAKEIWCAPQNIDAKASKNAIKYNWLWVTAKGGDINSTLLSFADEILNNINEYDHNKSLGYYRYGTDEHDRNKMLKEIITCVNEQNLAELLFQTNSRASKNNVQLIRIKDDNIMMYIIGKSIFKRGKFDVNSITTFKIIIMYND